MKKNFYEKRNYADCTDYNDNSAIDFSGSNNISYCSEKMEY